MKIILVAAVSDNHVIGSNNDLLWNMPADLKFFKKTISNKWVLVGRKSFESPQGRQIYFRRKNVIIISHDANYSEPPALTANGIDEALKLGEAMGAEELYILGGEEIYRQSINKADELLITEIHSEFEGDAFFPKIDLSLWEQFDRTNFLSDAENPYSYSFVRYRRKVSMNKKSR
jgi:dihydrofolate reductase